MQLNIEDEDTGETHTFTIQFRHVRNFKSVNVNKLSGRQHRLDINPYGGTTILSAVKDGHKLPRIYYARCHNDDHYNRRTGIAYCVQELIWDLINPAVAIKAITSLQGGKSFTVTIASSIDPVGDLKVFINPPRKPFVRELNG